MADRASVRVYRQGLGDCVIIRVKRRSGDDFKLLIDCGVVLGTANASDVMTRVVENLVKDTDQKVDAIAITHEHWDHVSGFTQAKDLFKKLKTDEVWVAWTEDKDDELANTLRSELGKAAQALAASVTALRAAGDSETVQMLADIALAPFGAAASASTSAALDYVKSMGKVRICRPSDKPFEIGERMRGSMCSGHRTIPNSSAKSTPRLRSRDLPVGDEWRGSPLFRRGGSAGQPRGGGRRQGSSVPPEGDYPARPERPASGW